MLAFHRQHFRSLCGHGCRHHVPLFGAHDGGDGGNARDEASGRKRSKGKAQATRREKAIEKARKQTKQEDKNQTTELTVTNGESRHLWVKPQNLSNATLTYRGVSITRIAISGKESGQVIQHTTHNTHTHTQHIMSGVVVVVGGRRLCGKSGGAPKGFARTDKQRVAYATKCDWSPAAKKQWDQHKASGRAARLKETRFDHGRFPSAPFPPPFFFVGFETHLSDSSFSCLSVSSCPFLSRQCRANCVPHKPAAMLLLVLL